MAAATVTRKRGGLLATFVLASVGLFMVTLDNLVVTTALPVIRLSLHAGMQGLEWTVNAYTLTFAVLLLIGAALGDRFGRRRMFVLGLVIFTAGSTAAALAPDLGFLIAARAVQGAGGALVTPLSLTILSAAVRPERRGVMIGAWGGIAGLAVALGPVVGGAVVQAGSWQWIFWLNVPIGLVTAPLAARRLAESRGVASRLDITGLALAAGGLFGLVFGIVRSTALGWTSVPVLTALAAGALLVAAFVWHETRTPSPMLEMRLFRLRGFTAGNIASFLMYVGMFGSIFLLVQFFQTAQGLSPLQSGIRTLAWTAMPLLIAPIAGALSDRIGGRLLMSVGLALQAGGLALIATVVSPHVSYGSLIPAFVMSGVGMGMFFAPVANVVLSAVGREREGQASGANNAIRELGGVLGVAVLSSVFSAHGAFDPPSAFVAGLRPALFIAVAAVGAGAIASLAVPSLRAARAGRSAEVSQMRGELAVMAAEAS